MISASGLLDASFREPTLDYVDSIKATRIMCGVDEARKLIQRALFNFLICNQNDHAKKPLLFFVTILTIGAYRRSMMSSIPLLILMNI
jgi:hypothetical protein